MDVVAIKNGWCQVPGMRIIKGNVYTVIDYFTCRCSPTRKLLYDVGIKVPEGYLPTNYCHDCNTSLPGDRIMWARATLFAPLPDHAEEIAELLESKVEVI